MKAQMKLYVWHGVFTDYTNGIAFALATSEEQARHEVAFAMSDGCYRPDSSYKLRYDELKGKQPDVYETERLFPVGFGIEGGG